MKYQNKVNCPHNQFDAILQKYNIDRAEYLPIALETAN